MRRLLECGLMLNAPPLMWRCMGFFMGEVIQYDDGGQVRLGAIKEAGKSLLVVNDQGQEVRVATRGVLFSSGLKVGTSGSAEQVAAALADLDQKLSELEGSGDLREAWEILLAEGEAVGLEGVAEWLLAETEPIHLMATWRVLMRQPAYFKYNKKKALYEARSAAQVEALLKQAEAEAAAKGAHQRFLDIVRALANDPAASPATLEEALADARFRKRFAVLERYALEGDFYDKAGAAGELIDELIGDRSNPALQIGGKGSVRAFEVMVAVGHFSPHENLAQRRAGLDVALDPAFIAAAEALSARLSFIDATSLDQIPNADTREDHLALPVVTIDSPSTKDIDDGLSLRRLEDGTIELGIHIADPAEVIPIDHELEAEARRRGTSVYAPHCTVPMFPKVLSENAMSLVAGVVRPAMSFFVRLGEDLLPVERRVAMTWIKPDHRLSYDEADEMISGAAEHERAEDLKLMYEASKVLLARRVAQGAAIFSIPEAKISVRFDEDGQPDIKVGVMRDTPSRQLVQEMMVLAGETVGLYCMKERLPVLYRTQQAPEDPEHFAALAGKIHPIGQAFQLRRYMKRGELADTPLGHFGLGLEAYVQATSPIRRYSDLMCHRQLRAHLRGEPLPFEPTQVGGIATQLGERAGEASQIEREGKRYWTLVWMQERQGQTVDATVLHYTDDRRRRVWVWIHDNGHFAQVAATSITQEGAQVKLKIDTVHPRRDLLVLKAVEEV